MALKSVDRIITAADYGGSMRGYLKKCQREFKRGGRDVTIKEIDKPTGTPVTARIWQSQWVADCECNTTMFVDPNEPIFFCFGCGNRLNSGRVRPVIFPEREERIAIEKTLLERPVEDRAGLSDLERVGLQRALVSVEVHDEHGRKKTLPLTRSWRPGETVETLVSQQAGALDTWRKELKHGVR